MWRVSFVSVGFCFAYLVEDLSGVDEERRGVVVAGDGVDGSRGVDGGDVSEDWLPGFGGVLVDGLCWAERSDEADEVGGLV